VIYDDTEISLFPPSENDSSGTFFLQDDSLAHSSVRDLLQACREVLGETIGEEDELEISVTDLGLVINEVIIVLPPSTSTSANSLVGVALCFLNKVF